MKTKTLLTTFLLFLTIATFGQTEHLNQLDAAGKKNGKWIIWLDNIWKEVKDSSKAAYCRYTYYDHGVHLYPMAIWGGKNWKLETNGGNPSQIGNAKLLDGEYKWIDNKGITKSTHKFNQGDCVYTRFFSADGTMYGNYEYTKKWYGLDHTYLVRDYDKKGNIKCFYMRKEKSVWQLYQDFTDSIVVNTIKVIGDSSFVISSAYLNGQLVCEKGQILIRTPQEQLGQFTQMMYHGKHTDWFTNGQKQLEGENNYGQKIGEWKYWHNNGEAYIPEKDFQ